MFNQRDIRQLVGRAAPKKGRAVHGHEPASDRDLLSKKALEQLSLTPTEEAIFFLQKKKKPGPEIYLSL